MANVDKKSTPEEVLRAYEMPCNRLPYAFRTGRKDDMYLDIRVFAPPHPVFKPAWSVPPRLVIDEDVADL